MTGFESPIERLVEIHNHHDSRLHGNAEKGDIADPHRHAEVIAKQLLQDEAAGERINRRENKHGRFHDGMKYHVEQHENHEEYDGQDNLEPLLGAQFKLVLAGPFVRVPRGQMNLLRQHVICSPHEVTIVPGIEVDVDVASKGAVFV